MLLGLLVLLVRRVVLLLDCVFVLSVLLVLLVRAKSFHKKKEFKIALITSFTLLLLKEFNL